MAALRSAEYASTGPGPRPRPGKRDRRGRVRPAGAEAGAGAPPRQLTLEEARCPVCLEILLQPVTMPCGHSVCLPCFRRTVELSSLCCPLCRLRVSSWARRQAREKRLVDAELWERVRQSYPERCRRRMESSGEAEACVADGIIFCKPRKIQQEYKKQMKNKLEDEEGASVEMNHKSLEEDQQRLESPRKTKSSCNPDTVSTVTGSVEHEVKKKVQSHWKKDECGTLKCFQEPFAVTVSDSEDEEKKKLRLQRRREGLGSLQLSEEPRAVVLSDSENEEPMGGRTKHMSAFKKTRNSPACSKRVQTLVRQRSRSCTDPEEGQLKSSCLSHVAAMVKTNVTYSTNAGILLSSENSCSFSAPILTPDKRQSGRSGAGPPAPLAGPPSKPERSISPESNDSISEELNHFKPIVCSPCTPPKRLPDGRVVEAAIVKSTPRNISRSLQKHTSYEASPTILQKWKQIEMDRQSTKAASKGTITSSPAEEFPLRQSPEGVACQPASAKKKTPSGHAALAKESLNRSLPAAVPQADGSGHEKGKASAGNKRRLVFDQPVEEGGGSGSQPDDVRSPHVVHPARGDPSSAAGQKPGSQGRGADPGELQRCAASGAPAPAQGEREKTAAAGSAASTPCGQERAAAQAARGRLSAGSRPASRRGRKRSRKTKHLEEAGRAKRPRPRSREESAAGREVDRSSSERRRQEEEDHRLAVKLQRRLDMERRTVDRGKGTPDKYLLRSWSAAAGAPDGLRRTARIGKRT
ncbi:E3 ubiquitin-protein ligase RNF169 [Lepisosteus oculatus]|uniref:E3 ubiquitin-protein ligase RNF169 n=1 Tax=Lepisosteus oculatus TaxID=7918 RepID=UPI0037131372